MLNLLCCYRNPSPKWLLGTQPSAEDAPAPFSWSPYLSHGSPLSRQRASTRGGEVSLAPQSLESWMPDYPQLFKLMLVGDEAAGKTCLLLRFTDKKYRTKHSTIGVEFGSRNVDVQGEGYPSAVLGLRRRRSLPQHHLQIPPWCCWCAAGLRHHAAGQLRAHTGMAAPHPGAHGYWTRHHLGW